MICAPGINSTRLPGGKYGYLSGTSMAAPFVTGAFRARQADCFPTPARRSLCSLCLPPPVIWARPALMRCSAMACSPSTTIVAAKAPAAASVYAYGAWNDFLMFDGLGRLALAVPAAGAMKMRRQPGRPRSALRQAALPLPPSRAKRFPAGLPVWASMGASLAVADASGGISGRPATPSPANRRGSDPARPFPAPAFRSACHAVSVSSGGNSAATTAPNVMAYASLAGETAFADLYGGAAWLNRFDPHVRSCRNFRNDRWRVGRFGQRQWR